MAEGNTELTFGDRLQDWWDYTIAPFTESTYTPKEAQESGDLDPKTNLPVEVGSREYYGARPGLDWADPLDLGWSALSSIYRGFEKGILTPTMLAGVDIAEKISPNQIKGPSDLEDFANEYLPEDIREKWIGGILRHNPGASMVRPAPPDYSEPLYLDYVMSRADFEEKYPEGYTEAQYNYNEVMGALKAYQEAYKKDPNTPPYIDNYPLLNLIDYDRSPFGENYFEMPHPGYGRVFSQEVWGYKPGGVSVSPTREDELGVSAGVVAEELAHAERWLRDHPGSRNVNTRDLPGYFGRVTEEIGAKLEAIVNVYKNEGIAMGTLNLPSVLASAASYVLPQAGAYGMGVPASDPSLIQARDIGSKMEDIGFTTPDAIKKIMEETNMYPEEIWYDAYPDTEYPKAVMENFAPLWDPRIDTLEENLEYELGRSQRNWDRGIVHDITKWLKRY